MTSVLAYPRLHLGLIDLAGTTGRRYGGVGVALAAPPAKITAIDSDVIALDFPPTCESRMLHDVATSLARLQEMTSSPGLRVSLANPLPPHVGLGSKTATILAALSAARLHWGVDVPDELLQRLSGRGAASGIGIHAFFVGGFLVDAGHPANPDDAFVPSSAAKPRDIPPLNARVDFPSDWVFHLMLPPGRTVSGREETEFFLRNTPLPPTEVHHVLAIVYHGLLPAVHEADFEQFAHWLARIQTVGFKAREIDEQWGTVHELSEQVRQATRLPVGMSSMGPLLFAVAPATDKSLSSEINQICRQHRSSYLGAFPARNAGFHASAATPVASSRDWSELLRNPADLTSSEALH